MIPQAHSLSTHAVPAEPPGDPQALEAEVGKQLDVLLEQVTRQLMQGQQDAGQQAPDPVVCRADAIVLLIAAIRSQGHPADQSDELLVRLLKEKQAARFLTRPRLRTDARAVPSPIRQGDRA